MKTYNEILKTERNIYFLDGLIAEANEQLATFVKDSKMFDCCLQTGNEFEFVSFNESEFDLIEEFSMELYTERTNHFLNLCNYVKRTDEYKSFEFTQLSFQSLFTTDLTEQFENNMNSYIDDKLFDSNLEQTSKSMRLKITTNS